VCGVTEFGTFTHPAVGTIIFPAVRVLVRLRDGEQRWGVTIGDSPCGDVSVRFTNGGTHTLTVARMQIIRTAEDTSDHPF
jgi:hypothetical protein